ncbi:hypothetical protein [Pseudoduganella armeniaca]|uniref:hypothetical protein n=1 Tax=Pseudoduganella armeniaca TaxID=2072590 RepID=UPI0011B1DB86|nr:hypothetical protein [Pseudoduganella armeniaca]
MKNFPKTVTIELGDDDIPTDEVLQNDRHYASAEVSSVNNFINLTFATRDAFYDFSRSLLREAMFGTGGQLELYPLVVDGKPQVVDGCRLTESSARIFIFYPDGTGSAD